MILENSFITELWIYGIGYLNAVVEVDTVDQFK